MLKFNNHDADRVRAVASSVIEKHSVPGLSVGVVIGADLVFAEGFGHADIEAKTPMRPELRQRIASITKTMIGLCVLALVDERKLSLDARVVGLLPDVQFNGPASGMTVWHLLTHTSGIGEAPTLERLRSVANPNRAESEPPGDFADLYPEGIVVEQPPGAKWAYANNGYALLGEIIVRCEKDQLENVLQRRIFDRLGMRDTDMAGVEHAELSTCYHRAPNEDARYQIERAGIAIEAETPIDGINIRGKFSSDFNKAMVAAGGVQSTVHDMAKYASALLSGGAGMVQAATLKKMMAPQYCPDERLINWGLSFSRTPRFGRTVIGHGGAYFGGWNSNLAVIPDESVAVIQHMNIMLDEPAPVFSEILAAVLNAPKAQIEQRRFDPQILHAAPGVYELTMPGPLTNFRPATRVGRVEISRDDDALVLRSRWGAWKQGVRLVPFDASDPAVLAVDTDALVPKLIVLDRDNAGAVKGIRLDELVSMPRREQDA